MAAHALKAASPIQTPSGDKARKSVTYAEVLPFLSKDERERRRLAFGSLFAARGVRAKIARAWSVAELAVEAVERADAKLGLPRGGR